MPVFRCNNALHYFAHVPKCGGQSVEAYLTERFGSLAFLDNQHYRLKPWERWTRSSPQHVCYSDLRLLFPTDWIASSFAVVRNPYNRAMSAYNFCSMHLSTVAPLEDAFQWLKHSAPRKGRVSFVQDNHLRRQSEFIPFAATVFALEDGLSPIIAHLDHLEGKQSAPREFPHLNKAGVPLGKTPEDTNTRSQKHPVLSRQPAPTSFYDLVAEVYANDFQRFGYDPGIRPDLFMEVPQGPTWNRLRFAARKWRKRLRKCRRESQSA